jgi:hypothetical protein
VKEVTVVDVVEELDEVAGTVVVCVKFGYGEVWAADRCFCNV